MKYLILLEATKEKLTLGKEIEADNPDEAVAKVTVILQETSKLVANKSSLSEEDRKELVATFHIVGVRCLF